MTQNEVSIIKNSVLDATEAYVDARLSMASFVKTEIGVVIANPTKNSSGKYVHTVQCNATSGSNGVTYNNVLSIGNIGFPKDSVVFLIAPNAQYSNQFILGKLDTSPANIVGGEIHIGEYTYTSSGSTITAYYFNVNDSGNVTIRGANSSIQLAEDANDTGYYNVNLSRTGLKLGHVTGDGNSYYFTVSNTGNVVIKSGSILLGQVGSTSNYNVNVNSSGLGLGYNSSRPQNYNFTVDTSGNMNMYQGSINLGTSTSTTSGCAFYVDTNGKIESVSGTIGSFEITSTSIGDRLGATDGVGMISRNAGSNACHIYAYSGSGLSEKYIKMYPDELKLNNSTISVDYGSSWIHISSQQVENNNKGYVVWHSEINDLIDDRLRHYNLIS